MGAGWARAGASPDRTTLRLFCGRELCSYINEAIREDSGPMFETVIPLTRMINQLLVNRGGYDTDKRNPVLQCEGRDMRRVPPLSCDPTLGCCARATELAKHLEINLHFNELQFR